MYCKILDYCNYSGKHLAKQIRIDIVRDGRDEEKKSKEIKQGKNGMHTIGGEAHRIGEIAITFTFSSYVITRSISIAIFRSAAC